MITKKVCVVGDFSVGKTSLTRRFVENIFSEKYQTTVGVKIDTKEVALEHGNVKLVIWDLAGEEKLAATAKTYLKMSQGLILVVDGTRQETFESAQRIFLELPLPKPPTAFLVNKADLIEEWEITESEIRLFSESFNFMLYTSAKNGENVETAFRQLAELMV
ncbi:Rab family GTPase [Pseudoalteromonas sp.]|uniref:Rab family GTPase n=1 Tax=Pseudoalteromonas sp. TaxID=53249 RepID=UPI0035664EE5